MVEENSQICFWKIVYVYVCVCRVEWVLREIYNSFFFLFSWLLSFLYCMVVLFLCPLFIFLCFVLAFYIRIVILWIPVSYFPAPIFQLSFILKDTNKQFFSFYLFHFTFLFSFSLNFSPWNCVCFYESTVILIIMLQFTYDLFLVKSGLSGYEVNYNMA